jgi:DNA damage-binding protein 1
MSFESDPTTAYYVIGSCFVNDDEPEPKLGRILVFRLSENKLNQICEREIKGAPYCMQNFNGKLLVSISNSLKLFELKDNQLNALASYSDNVFIIHLKCKNDFILTGDMMKSCAVLTYRHDSNTFELVARDHSPVWLSSIEMLDDDNFLMSDCFQNVITLKKDSGQSNEDERKSLQNYGCIHLGEQINVFRHGSLGMEQQSNELVSNHFQCRILSGTVSGSIILFAHLSNVMFKILNELQIRLSKFFTTPGKIPYEKWRDFDSERRIEPHKYFIDGDLIETFLELTYAEASNLIKDFKVDNSTMGHSNEEFSVNYFNKLVEELSRLH